MQGAEGILLLRKGKLSLGKLKASLLSYMLVIYIYTVCIYNLLSNGKRYHEDGTHSKTTKADVSRLDLSLQIAINL